MNPFDRCEKLTEIIFSEENNYYAIENGVLFDKKETILLAYPGGKQDKSYEVPNSVTEIAYAAFSENNFIGALRTKLLWGEDRRNTI